MAVSRSRFPVRVGFPPVNDRQGGLCETIEEIAGWQGCQPGRALRIIRFQSILFNGDQATVHIIVLMIFNPFTRIINVKAIIHLPAVISRTIKINES